jgi:hypothetical protein
MKKFILFVVSGVFLFSACKKDSTSVTTTTDSNQTLQAYINGSIWTPDTLSASITYSSSNHTKVFEFGGQKSQKKIDVLLTQSASSNNQSFGLGTYSTVVANYYAQQKDNNGNYVFVQDGTTPAGSASVTITAIDTVKKTITGTFGFTATKNNYDSNGNVVSIDINSATSGVFNALPYTFIKQ